MSQHAAVVAIASLWLALLVDRLLGEPPARWHPVVWMGWYLGWTGRRIAPRACTPEEVEAMKEGAAEKPDRLRFLAGALAWSMGAAAVLLVALALQMWLDVLPAWAAIVLGGLVLKPLLAWRMLADEVRAVEHALATSLEAGQRQLGRLVSRDVTALAEHEVRESAIESLAENLNDSLVAPLFWFALAGLPGAALYRFANTADAMWGYRGVRGNQVWEWAGKFAARADDVLSWVPARVTAALLALAGRRWVHGLHRQARRTPSPNSGWPMGAIALLLGVRLGKPGVYVINEGARTPVSDDTARVLRLAGHAVLLAGLAASALTILWAPR